MRFNIAFGKTNVFSLDLVPVTNLQYVNKRREANEEVSDHDAIAAMLMPDAPHHNATFERAKAMCEGGTVVFA